MMIPKRYYDIFDIVVQSEDKILLFKKFVFKRFLKSSLLTKKEKPYPIVQRLEILLRN